MASYSTNEFKSGLKVMLDNDPCAILENEFVKPGKGQAFNRVKFRNLKSGRVWERTFKSGESIEAADVMETDIQFTEARMVDSLGLNIHYQPKILVRPILGMLKKLKWELMMRTMSTRCGTVLTTCHTMLTLETKERLGAIQ